MTEQSVQAFRVGLCNALHKTRFAALSLSAGHAVSRPVGLRQRRATADMMKKSGAGGGCEGGGRARPVTGLSKPPSQQDPGRWGDMAGGFRRLPAPAAPIPNHRGLALSALKARHPFGPRRPKGWGEGRLPVSLSRSGWGCQRSSPPCPLLRGGGWGLATRHTPPPWPACRPAQPHPEPWTARGGGGGIRAPQCHVRRCGGALQARCGGLQGNITVLGAFLCNKKRCCTDLSC